ncbi:MAG: ATP synthase F0 subunit C [bacterium]|nr:ATP synthase F0 subunit C [bacterium]
MIKRILVFFAFVSAVFAADSAFAAEEAVAIAAGSSELAKFGLALGAGLGLGLAAAIGALGQSKAVAAAMEGISRNPNASDKMFLPLILGLVFMESLVIYMLVVAFFLQGKI